MSHMSRDGVICQRWSHTSNSWHAGRYKFGSPHLRSHYPLAARTLYHSYLDMNRRQQVLSFPRVPTTQERMLDVIRRSHNSIQAFDPRTRSLKMFPWYVLTL